MEKYDFGKHIIKLSNQIKRTIDNSIAEYGLTGAQARVIRYLYEQTKVRDIYQRDVEEEFDIRRSSVTSILQLLEKKGCITRESVKEDGRLKHIRLTQRGIEVHMVVTNTIAQLEQNFSDSLSIEETKLFLEIIQKLSSKVGTK